MSDKNKKANKNEVKEKTYRNPAETKAGKALIWILIFGMAGIVLISAIAIIIQAL